MDAILCAVRPMLAGSKFDCRRRAAKSKVVHAKMKTAYYEILPACTTSFATLISWELGRLETENVRRGFI